MKPANMDYFSTPSRDMYYTLGAFYGAGLPFGIKGISFRSSCRDLVELIRDELESEHTIISDPRTESYWFVLHSAKRMRQDLLRQGFYGLKKDRTWPAVPEDYEHDFVRGFFESKARLNVTRNKIRFRLSKSFVRSLKSYFSRRAYIRSGSIIGCALHYGAADSTKVIKHLYSDMDRIESGLFVPWKKDMFERSEPKHYTQKKRHERVQIIKNLVLQGRKPHEFYEEVGYSNPFSVYRSFKAETGMTIGEWKQKQS